MVDSGTATVQNITQKHLGISPWPEHVESLAETASHGKFICKPIKSTVFRYQKSPICKGFELLTIKCTSLIAANFKRAHALKKNLQMITPMFLK